MSGNKYKYTDTNAPTMAEECYRILRKKSRYSKSALQNQLKNLETRFEILEDDLIELKREIDDIKMKLSQTKSKTKHITSYDSSGSD
jgi:predicted  nucleic acid-binding Zn-ribbon protein